MKESEIIICGHGSGCPSIKNLAQYCKNRFSLKASNGKDKGIVAVVRFLTTEEQRKQFKSLYATIIGRNIYSQNLRQYVYTPKDGKYYSDCSSSGCHTYDKCGVNGVKDYNTASMYNNGTKVDVTIKDGHIVDVDKLKVGDALLFRGNDPSRPLQIGHVEYVYELPVESKWEKLSNGDWVYKEGDTLAEGWREINSHWFYFKNNVAVKGYQVIGNERFYFETDGDLECALLHTNDRGALVVWNTKGE